MAETVNFYKVQTWQQDKAFFLADDTMATGFLMIISLILKKNKVALKLNLFQDKGQVKKNIYIDKRE